MLRIEIALAWKRTLAREGVDANRATPAKNTAIQSKPQLRLWSLGHAATSRGNPVQRSVGRLTRVLLVAMPLIARAGWCVGTAVNDVG